MKLHFKKIITLCMAMLLVIGMMPTTAFAASKSSVSVSAKGASIKNNSLSLTATGTSQLTVIVKKGKHNVTKKATYKVSNSKVASVNKSGKITAKRKGSCTITIRYKKVTKKLKLKVTAPATRVKVNNAYANNLSMKVKKSSQLMLVLGYKNSGAGKYSYKAVTPSKTKWTSSNKKVVTVNKNGRVTAQNPGRAVITMTYGSVSKKLNVTVASPETSSQDVPKTEPTKPSNDKPSDNKPSDDKPSTPSDSSDTGSRKDDTGSTTPTPAPTPEPSEPTPAPHVHNFVETHDVTQRHVWEWYNGEVEVTHCACGLDFYSDTVYPEYGNASGYNAWKNHAIQVILDTGSNNGHSHSIEYCYCSPEVNVVDSNGYHIVPIDGCHNKLQNHKPTGHWVVKTIHGPAYGKCSCGATDSRYNPNWENTIPDYEHPYWGGDE